MGSQIPATALPDRDSHSLRLSHPTYQEKVATWLLNSKSWGSALDLDSYLEREEYLTKVPLARNDGVTHWILVDTTASPDDRAIYASCESLRKRSLVRTAEGKLKEVICHGIGSVFANPKYRGKGYAGRMLKDLALVLRTWQIEKNVSGREECMFSFLYSDIGKNFYANMGWQPFPSSHISFPLVAGAVDNGHVKPLVCEDLLALCEFDEENIRKSLQNVKNERPHVYLVPDYEVMQWHHLREDFMTGKLFGKSPTTKGAIVGEEGSRVWAIWTRAYYGPLDGAESGNTLYILRLIVEDEQVNEANTQALKSILELAQAEAAEWRCQHVALWNPTENVKGLVGNTKLDHESVDRQSDSIASLMWYGSKDHEKVDDVEWLGNEKYGWC
ncbi:hypothetical protein BJ878DRAFT_302556 [Calycina marina]|uniref:LYC1 C-terminal domain-containing protein n=1 Tax=Calycina marina TaxID=1763456 RepID=A0A9P8CGU5_9HELO|nr:hypothetical protein BJ878DRAFT_302556 [Calycina marina]